VNFLGKPFIRCISGAVPFGLVFFLLLIATLFWVARNKFDIPSKAADLKESVGGVTKKEQKVNSGGSGVFDSGRTI